MTASQRVAARYPDSIEERLVGAIAAQHGVEPAQVLLGCGSGEILRMADMAFLGPEQSVVAAEPTFEAVLEYARVTRARAGRPPAGIPSGTIRCGRRSSRQRKRT